jgi:hypothetical protein
MDPLKYSEKIQNLLPLGYLYLIVLGLIKETVFFYQIGINYIKYASIVDVLISPIATLTTHPIVFVVIALVFYLSYKLPSFLYKNDHKKWVQNHFKLKFTKATESDETIKNYYNLMAVTQLAFGLLSIFLGYGIAEGFGVSRDIKNDKLKFHNQLNYTTGESEVISLLEANSEYLFYVTKGEKLVKIAPVGNIKNLVLTKTNSEK